VGDPLAPVPEALENSRGGRHPTAVTPRNDQPGRSGTKKRDSPSVRAILSKTRYIRIRGFE